MTITTIISISIFCTGVFLEITNIFGDHSKEDLSYKNEECFRKQISIRSFTIFLMILGIGLKVLLG